MNGIAVGNSFVITRAERDAQVVSKIYRHVDNLKEFKITQEKRDPEMRKECVSVYGEMCKGGGGGGHPNTYIVLGEFGE
jgi:hypothetical protein